MFIQGYTVSFSSGKITIIVMIYFILQGIVDRDSKILDDKPMTTLGYLNGPGMDVDLFMLNGRPNVTGVNTCKYMIYHTYNTDFDM